MIVFHSQYCVSTLGNYLIMHRIEERRFYTVTWKGFFIQMIFFKKGEIVCDSEKVITENLGY